MQGGVCHSTARTRQQTNNDVCQINKKASKKARATAGPEEHHFDLDQPQDGRPTKPWSTSRSSPRGGIARFWQTVAAHFLQKEKKKGRRRVTQRQPHLPRPKKGVQPPRYWPGPGAKSQTASQAVPRREKIIILGSVSNLVPPAARNNSPAVAGLGNCSGSTRR